MAEFKTLVGATNGFVNTTIKEGSGIKFDRDVPGEVTVNVTSGQIEVPFAYGDATPLALGTVPAGTIIQGVELVITEGFDGSSPALTVGDAGDTDRLMTAAQNDPATVATYASHPGHEYGSATALTLSITPGSGASLGGGVVIIRF